MLKYSIIFEKFTFSDIIDLLLMTVIIYYIYQGISKTRVLPILQAFLVILFITFLTAIFDLKAINYILEYIVSLMLLAAIILFPAEIKRGLYQLGGTTLFSRFLSVENQTIKNILQAVVYLKEKKIGSLIVVQKKDNLTSLIESGVQLNAEVDVNLIITLFHKNSLLHDGAMVISGNKLLAAACYIANLSFTNIESSQMGSRHRAALGLSEQADAFIIVVSEETGLISICNEGKMIQRVSIEKLKRAFKHNFLVD